MKAVLQKSGKAFVEVENKICGQINEGLVIFLGIKDTDTKEDADYLVDKIINLRIFEDGEKYFEKSVLDKTKEALVISQFTLYADCRSGRRPDFIKAAKAEIAKPLYEYFIEKIKKYGINTETGIFGAMMKVNLVNIGPVTIILESENNIKK